MGIRWRYTITTLSAAKEIVKNNPDCHIEVSMGSSPGYHIMKGKTVLCRISKASFGVLNDGYTEEQPPFINVATYKVKQTPFYA